MLDEAFQNSAEKEKETPHSIVYRRDCECWWWWLVLRGEHLLARGVVKVKVRYTPSLSMASQQITTTCITLRPLFTLRSLHVSRTHLRVAIITRGSREGSLSRASEGRSGDLTCRSLAPRGRAPHSDSHDADDGASTSGLAVACAGAMRCIRHCVSSSVCFNSCGSSAAAMAACM